MIVSKIINNKLIDLSKRKFTTILKTEFDKSILEVMKLDKNDYKPKNTYKQEKDLKIFNEIKENTEKIKKELIENNIIQNEKYRKLIKNLYLYIGRYENSTELVKKLKMKRYILKNLNTLLEVEDITENEKTEFKQEVRSIGISL